MFSNCFAQIMQLRAEISFISVLDQKPAYAYDTTIKNFNSIFYQNWDCV